MCHNDSVIFDKFITTLFVIFGIVCVCLYRIDVDHELEQIDKEDKTKTVNPSGLKDLSPKVDTTGELTIVVLITLLTGQRGEGILK